MSTYTHAGVSRLDGKIKMRFANSADRVKVLVKGGHTDIDLIELKYPMTKEQVVEYFLEINYSNGNAEIQAAIEEAKEKLNPAPKAPKEPKAAKAGKAPRAPKAPKTAEDRARDNAVMKIRIAVNEMIENGTVDEADFDKTVAAMVAAMDEDNARNAAREAAMARIRAKVDAMVSANELPEADFDKTVDELFAAESEQGMADEEGTEHLETQGVTEAEPADAELDDQPY